MRGRGDIEQRKRDSVCFCAYWGPLRSPGDVFLESGWFGEAAAVLEYTECH